MSIYPFTARKIITFAALLLGCNGQFVAAKSPPVPQIADWRPPVVRLTDASSQPIALRDIQIRTEIFGALARTQIEMRLFNPNARILEGELQFPLLEGQVVSGFALDINGRLREAVSVPKARGQEIFEDIRRRRVDPALLEATAGNQYKLRVYPIPARGERRVMLTITERLGQSGTRVNFRLPLIYSNPVDRLSVEVFASGVAENDMVIERGGSDAKRSRDTNGAVMRIDRERWQSADATTGWLQLTVPVTERERVLVGETNGKRYFAADIPFIDETVRRAEPKHIALIWDASASAKNQQRVLAVLDAFFKSTNGSARVNLLVVRNRVEPVRTFRVNKGDWSSLSAALRAEPYDGSSNFDSLPIPGDVDLSILVSDGLATDGKRDIGYAHRAPLIVLSGALAADVPRLTRIAEKSGGRYVDALAATPAESAAVMWRDGWRVVAMESYGAETLAAPSLTVRDGRLQVAGLLRDSESRVTLTLRHPARGVRYASVDVSDNKRETTTATWPGQLWATWRVASLSDAPHLNATAMQAISAEHGLVGPNASLIVLELASDYAQYDLPAPPELRADVETLRSQRNSQQQQTQSAHIERTVQQFDARQRWWDSKFPKDGPKIAERAKSNAGAIGDVSGTTVRDSMARRRESVAEEKALVMPGVPAPAAPPAPSAPAPATSTSTARSLDSAQPRQELSAGAPAKAGRDALSRAASSTIQLKAWSPDTPYLSRLRSVNVVDLYPVYLDLREEYKDSSAFILDVSAHFFERGKNELALRVLSNLAEMNLENRQLLRLYAYRLNEAKQFALAIPVFERVAQLAPNEPQSWRDLGLAHADNGSPQQAVDALWRTVSRPWHQRFEGINMIALAEMNAVIANANTPLQLAHIERRLIRNMPLDLRVVMAWDTDDTDIDLWVTDPNGESSSYNNRLSYQGAAMGPDATGGYGPEEFALRAAKRGKYQIKAQFYGHRQQVLSAGTTVMVRVTTGFGTKSAKDQWLTLRLTRGQETVQVGEVEIR
jgi:Ca-activated chloride channel homolog